MDDKSGGHRPKRRTWHIAEPTANDTVKQRMQALPCTPQSAQGGPTFARPSVVNGHGQSWFVAFSPSTTSHKVADPKHEASSPLELDTCLSTDCCTRDQTASTFSAQQQPTVVSAVPLSDEDGEKAAKVLRTVWGAAADYQLPNSAVNSAMDGCGKGVDRHAEQTPASAVTQAHSCKTDTKTSDDDHYDQSQSPQTPLSASSWARGTKSGAGGARLALRAALDSLSQLSLQDITGSYQAFSGFSASGIVAEDPHTLLDDLVAAHRSAVTDAITALQRVVAFNNLLDVMGNLALAATCTGSTSTNDPVAQLGMVERASEAFARVDAWQSEGTSQHSPSLSASETAVSPPQAVHDSSAHTRPAGVGLESSTSSPTGVVQKHRRLRLHHNAIYEGGSGEAHAMSSLQNLPPGMAPAQTTGLQLQAHYRLRTLSEGFPGVYKSSSAGHPYAKASLATHSCSEKSSMHHLTGRVSNLADDMYSTWLEEVVVGHAPVVTGQWQVNMQWCRALVRHVRAGQLWASKRLARLAGSSLPAAASTSACSTPMPPTGHEGKLAGCHATSIESPTGGGVSLSPNSANAAMAAAITKGSDAGVVARLVTLGAQLRGAYLALGTQLGRLQGASGSKGL